MKARFATLPLVVLAAAFLTLAGCGGGEEVDLDVDTTGVVTDMGQEEEMTAVAMLEPTEGNNARGTVTFTQMDGAVQVQADLTGLAPGQHGFHVHENGDCSNNAEAAGGHFAPQGNPHGAPDAPMGQRHVGDFGNLDVGADSTANYTRVDSLIALEGMNSIVGKAVVIHANADDLQSQPSGNSGPRVACGVVQMQGAGMDMMQDTSAVADPATL